MAAPVLQFKRGNLASLPGLQAGEPGFTVDKNDLYVGIDSTTGNNQFIGSGRFWSKGDATNASGVKLVEAQNNGASAITLKAPAALGDNQVYTMPAAAVASGFLKCNGSGEFSFDTAPQNAGSVTTVTVQIVTLLVGDHEFDSTKTMAAFALGITLFLIKLLLNVIALRVVRKYREKYE